MTTDSMLAAVRNAAAPGYAELTVEGLRQNRPDLVTAIEKAHDITAQLASARSEGETAGKTAGAAAERSRIRTIQKAAFDGQDALVATLIDEGKSPGDAALALNEDYRLHGSNIDALAAQDRHVADVKPAPAAPKVAAAATGKPEAEMSDDELKARYAGSADLKREFPNADSYLGYVKGMAAGRIRILARKDAA